jgi:hypothetical protein
MMIMSKCQTRRNKVTFSLILFFMFFCFFLVWNIFWYIVNYNLEVLGHSNPNLVNF